MENELIYEFSVDNDVIKERFELSRDRLKEMQSEHLSNEANRGFDAYFHAVGSSLLTVLDNYDFIQRGEFDKASLEELQKRNHELYQDILPENYDKSYGNPAFAVKEFGDEYGKILSALYFDIRSIIGPAYENRLFAIVIRLELFIEVFGMFLSEDQNGRTARAESVKDAIYWYLSDYSEDMRLWSNGGSRKELRKRHHSFK